MKLLVLDLDETLVHASERPLARACDFMVGKYFVYQRPHLQEFIQYCFNHFQVAVWTSSSEDYATELIYRIFPDANALEFMFSRKKCIYRFDPEIIDYYYLKDLNKVKRKGFPLARIIAVDDSPEKYRRNFGNLVRIKPFIGNEDDVELLKLMKYLDTLKSVENIRKVEKRGWYHQFTQ